MPSSHETMGSSHYLAHDDVTEAMNGDNISIRTTEEMQKYESLRR
jgi:ribosomal protein S17